MLGWEYKNTKYCQQIREGNALSRFDWARNTLELMRHGFDFEDIVFTDESKVPIEIGSRKQCRRIGEEIKGQGKRKVPQSVLIWGGISRRGKTCCKIFTGIMDAEVYVTILDECLVPAADQIYGPGQWRLMQDNDPKHTSLRARAYFDEAGVNWWQTPAESPDINPIELVWADMKHFLRKEWFGRAEMPETLASLVEGIEYWWTHRLTVFKCNRYIDHMYKVIKKVIAKEGKPSGYIDI